MEKLAKLRGIIAIVAVIGISVLGCRETGSGNVPIIVADLCSDCGEIVHECICIPVQNPVASDFTIGNLYQVVGNVSPVTITPKDDKSTGEITIYYDGLTELPIAAGTYTVTFDVAESAGWNAVSGLNGEVLTINKASGIFDFSDEINIVYTPELTLASLHLSAGLVWDNPTIKLNAGSGQQFSATYTDPSGNFEPIDGVIIVNVVEAVGVFISPFEINTTYISTLTLNDLFLPTGYTWDNPEIKLNAGNGQQFPATYIDSSGNYEAASGNITVNVAKAHGVFKSSSAINATYTKTLKLGDLSLPIGYSWNNPATSLNAGNGQQFPAIYTDPNGNYTSANGNITVNVAKAPGVFITPSEINTTYTPTLTLTNLNLPSDYIWNIPSTKLNAGNGQLFQANYTDPSGNYEAASGNITVNVAKAIGSFNAHNVINITYSPTLTLANLTLTSGYTWNNPATSLSVGNGQIFHATYADPSGNYESASGNIIVNVTEAKGNFPVLATINTTYTTTLTLADISLPIGYKWNAPSTGLNAGNGQLFQATYTNPSGNYEPATGNITVNVAKATGTFITHSVIDVTYTTTLRLSNITLSNGYTWNSSTTSLNAGNDQSFSATYTDPSGNYTLASGNITVNVAKAAGTFGNPSAINTTYTSALTLANLALTTGYSWNTPSTKLNAGNGQSFSATYTDPSGNYTSASGNITVNVAKATGSFLNHDPISIIYEPAITLANISLSSGYTWNTPSISLNAGDGQSFSATYTDPSGNYTSASGNITVNIAKATGIFGNPAVINTTYSPVLTLANLTLSTGYAWNNPSTSLNAGDGQMFTAVYTHPSGNYTAVGGNITVNVVKAVGSTVNIPTLNNRTHDSITINTVTVPVNGQTVEYAINTINNAPVNGWQTGLIFKDLSSGTTYYIFARSASNSNYNAGTAVSIDVMTMLQENFTITFNQIADAAPIILDQTISRTGNNKTLTLTVANAGQYSSITWHVTGTLVSGSGASFTLNATNSAYNRIGEYFLTIEVWKENKPYNKTIIFTVTP